MKPFRHTCSSVICLYPCIKGMESLKVKGWKKSAWWSYARPFASAVMCIRKPVAYDLLVAVTFTIAQTVASTPYQWRKQKFFFRSSVNFRLRLSNHAFYAWLRRLARDLISHIDWRVALTCYHGATLQNRPFHARTSGIGTRAYPLLHSGSTFSVYSSIAQRARFLSAPHKIDPRKCPKVFFWIKLNIQCAGRLSETPSVSTALLCTTTNSILNLGQASASSALRFLFMNGRVVFLCSLVSSAIV